MGGPQLRCRPGAAAARRLRRRALGFGAPASGRGRGRISRSASRTPATKPRCWRSWRGCRATAISGIQRHRAGHRWRRNFAKSNPLRQPPNPFAPPGEPKMRPQRPASSLLKNPMALGRRSAKQAFLGAKWAFSPLFSGFLASQRIILRWAPEFFSRLQTPPTVQAADQSGCGKEAIFLLLRPRNWCIRPPSKHMKSML